MRTNFHYFVRTLIDWMFRRSHPALYIIRCGVLLLVILIGAQWAFSVIVPTNYGPVTIQIDSDGGSPTLLKFGLLALALILCVFGIVWYTLDQKNLARKKVIVIEVRGLKDLGGQSLYEAVPKKIRGYRDQVLVDLHRSVQDGTIVNVNAALNQLVSLPTDLKRRETGIDRRDLTYVYGGLAPVPLTFLIGVLIDDESAITVMDWDRHLQIWRELDDDDDGQYFSAAELSCIGEDTKEVALAVSVSYRINLSDVRLKVGETPIVQLTLPSGSTECHWSGIKQKVLGQQFLNCIIELGNRGIKCVHLFLAAQNSLVFRFGRLYDQRNLPELIVYQFQREEIPPYPLGIKMPVGGNPKPELVK